MADRTAGKPFGLFSKVFLNAPNFVNLEDDLLLMALSDTK